MNKKIFVVMLLGIFMLSLGSAELIDDAHGQSLSYDVNGTTSLGVFFKANTNLIFVGVTREHDTVTTRAILKYASNGTIIETSTNLNGDNFAFSNTSILNTGVEYIIELDANGLNYANYRSAVISYPFNKININYTHGGAYGNMVNNRVYNVLSIQTSDNVTVEVTEVETTLYAPADNSLLSDVGANFTTIHTPTKMNLTNATYIVWKLNGGTYNLFNSTNISLSGNETINSTLFIDSFTLGKYKWNTQTCGENSTGFVDCSFAPANYSYEVGASILNETYNAITYETTSETFTTTVSVLEDIILYDSKLNYNGTVYTGTITSLGNNTYNLSKTINVPVVSVNENMTFYWEMSYDNGGTITTQDLTEYNQTVLDSSAISITSSSCPAGFFETINYTFKDAENLSSLTANVNYNYKYGIGNLSGLKIFGEFNDITSFRVCINDSISDYKLGYGEIQYSLTGYSDRRFYSYYNQSLSNETTREYELLSLQNADSTSFIFEVKNTFLNPYTNKFISLLRWYPETDEYKVVETALTDTDGKTVMKVKTEDVNYRVGVYEQNGTLIKLADSVRMACLVDPCTYTLRIIHDPQDYYSIYDVESSLTFDENNNRFLYIWNDPEQITSAMRLEVFKVTGNQDILICNETTSSYTGVMICSIGNYTGDFYAKVYRSAFPEKIISTLYYTIRTGVESSFGLFLSVIFTLLTGLIGIFSPVGAIVMLVMGLLPALLFGAINLAIFMGIATLGGIIIHYLLKKGNN